MPSPRLTDVAGAAVYTGRTEQAIRSITMSTPGAVFESALLAALAEVGA